MPDNIAIDSIAVGERLREDLGDLTDLMASIQQHGLLHPVVVDAERTLIAGERRLEALRRLGKRRVEVRFYGELSDRERRVLELEENVRRKDLTAYERSKMTKELVETAEEVVAEEVLGDSPKTVPLVNPPKGRPLKGKAPKQDVAERVGKDRKDIRDAESHVAAAERYPFLQGAEWSQRAALEEAVYTIRKRARQIKGDETKLRKLCACVVERFAGARKEVKSIQKEFGLDLGV